MRSAAVSARLPLRPAWPLKIPIVRATLPQHQYSRTPGGGTPRFGLSRRTNNIREDSDWPVQEEEQAHYDEEEFVVVSVVDDDDEEEEADDDEEEEDDDDDDEEEADESPASAFFARVDWATEAS